MKEKSLFLEILWRTALKLALVIAAGFLWKQYSKNSELYNIKDHILPVFSVLLFALAWLRYRYYDRGATSIATPMPSLYNDSNTNNAWSSDHILYCSKQWSDILCAVICLLPWVLSLIL